jgi:pyruvate,water dikinase
MIRPEGEVRPEEDRNLVIRKRDSAFRKIRSSLSRRDRMIFSIISRYLVRYIQFREFQRSYLDMILGKFRELFLEISARMVERGYLDDIDDIFFLNLGSVFDGLSGSEVNDLRSIAKFNRLSYENETGAPGRYLRNGISFDDTIRRSEKAAKAPGRGITGQPVSTGAHRGRVVVMKDLKEIPCLSKGDVLVTRSIDPGQTHLFLMAGALILEVGGLLSHGAILAREFNIPTVAGIKNATDIFEDNQIIVVNGTEGKVALPDEI